MSDVRWHSGPEDQVPRLAAFRVRHPDINIAAPGSVNGRWIATRNSKVVTSEFELIRLLDDLEAMFPKDGTRDGP